MINFIKLIKFFLRQFYCVAHRCYCVCRLVLRYPGVNINFPTIIKFDDIDSIKFGEDISIGSYSEIVVFKRSPSTDIEGRLEIGNRVVIGTGVNIRAAGGVVYISDGALLAQNISLIAANHSLNSPLFYRDAPWDTVRVGVKINKNAWIGAGVIILPGVTVGENSVIAAGSVVTKSVPNNQIWGGVPARFIKALNQYETGPL